MPMFVLFMAIGVAVVTEAGVEDGIVVIDVVVAGVGGALRAFKTPWCKVGPKYP